jgi:hypothetical protein
MVDFQCAFDIIYFGNWLDDTFILSLTKEKAGG